MTNRSVRFAVGSALALLLTAGSGVAFAQDPPPAEGTTPPPTGETAPPPAGDAAAAPAAGGAGPLVTLRQGGFSVDGDVVIGVSSDTAGEPISIVPNFYYGISDQLTVGLVHNSIADIFQTAGTGSGLCLTGEDGGCFKVYNNLGLDALFSFMRSSTMDIAFHGGLDFVSLSDPTALALRLGVKGKTMAGPVQIIFDPSISIGLTERSAGNEEFLILPARFGYLVTPQLNLGLSIALLGAFDGFGDNYFVPIGVGGVYSLNSQLDLRAQFSFDRLIAGVADGADARTLSIGAAYRM